MARIRTIKPEFFTSETITELTFAARLTFIGMWTEADDYGICADNARILKGHIWPLDDDITAADVAEHLDEFAKRGMVCRYEAEGRRWVHICGFGEHQTISHRSKRRNPAPPSHDSTPEPPETYPDQDEQEHSGGLPEPSGGLPEPSKNTLRGTGNREQGTGNTLRPPEPSGTPPAARPQAGAPPRQDALFDALCEVCGVTPAELTTSGRGAINSALRDLRAVNATPSEIRARAGRWSFNVKLTATGLAKHWATLGRPTSPRPAMNPQPIHVADTNGHRADPSKVAQLRPVRKEAP